MIKSFKEQMLAERDEQRKLREKHGTPSLTLAKEFLSLPYWARKDLGYLEINTKVLFWDFDISLLERKPHKIHETFSIDRYTHDVHVLTSLISKPISWRVESVSRFSKSNSFRFPCDHSIIIQLIFEKIADMKMEVTSFNVDKESGIVYIKLDDKYIMKDSFDDEYQALIKIYKFVWDLHNDIFCPSLTDLSGQFDIIYDDVGHNVIELYDMVAIGCLLQDYEFFAKRGDLRPRSSIRTLQNSQFFNGVKVEPINIGKVTLLEGDFLFKFVPNGP